MSTFSVFSIQVYHAVRMHTVNWLKIWFKKDFLRKKNAFLQFLPKKLSITKWPLLIVHEHANILWLNAIDWNHTSIRKHPKNN